MTEIGSILGARYRLLELLGQGGMATIYRARDAQLERDVAVKVLRPEFGQDPDFLARFRDEARAAASLSHPNIVAVFDFGEDNAEPYIVMELVDGQDLASILRENGPLAPRQAARVAADVGKALQAAHVRGIVHRDVKPSNILISRDGRVKVADFGIARALDEAQVTLPGVTMGSVHYFAPEQARGEPVTALSDVYSLGIVLFEMLTGQRPFSGDGAAAVALARLTTTPPRPSALRASVPPELDAIVGAGDGARAGRPLRLRRRDGRRARRVPHRRRRGAAGAAAQRGLAAGAAVVGAQTVASATAGGRPPVPYPPEAYARTTSPAPVTTRTIPPPPPGSAPGSPARRARGRGQRAVGLDRRPARHRHPGRGRVPAVPDDLRRRVVGRAQPAARPARRSSCRRSSNSLYTDAATQAAALGLSTIRAATQEKTDVPPDTVLSQVPAAGTSVAAGTVIQLTVVDRQDAGGRARPAQHDPERRGQRAGRRSASSSARAPRPMTR